MFGIIGTLKGLAGVVKLAPKIGSLINGPGRPIVSAIVEGKDDIADILTDALIYWDSDGDGRSDLTLAEALDLVGRVLQVLSAEIEKKG